jgi:hypothetical protein
MSGGKGNAAIVGAGVAACAVCCAGPIAAALTAIGIGTAAGAAVFGAGALLVGAVVVALVLHRRRRRSAAAAAACASGPGAEPVAVALGATPERR